VTDPRKLPAIYTSDTGRPDDLRRERATSGRMSRLAKRDDVTVVMCPKRHPLAVAYRSPFPAGLWRAWLGPHGRPVRLESPSVPMEVSCRCGRLWSLDPVKVQAAARSGDSSVPVNQAI